MYDANLELSSPDYLGNAEQILKELVLSEHRIVQASLHGKPVYIVADMSLAKEIFEDAKNFSFTPNPLSKGDALTDGAKAFVSKGLESPLTASSYDGYRDIRNLFNQAFRRSVIEQLDRIRARAEDHIAALLDEVQGPEIDALALCRNYWLPLAADVIGLGSLSSAELSLLAESTRLLIEANGLHGDAESVKALVQANKTIMDLIGKVIGAQKAPPDSALGYLLGEVGPEKAVELIFAFVLGGIDTGSTALPLQTHLLATNSKQRTDFLALSNVNQQTAITELGSKEAPAYYTLRFAVRDVQVGGFDIPAGAFVHLALHGLNSCANADFDVSRNQRQGCPAHCNETFPFGHARHRCPGEALARCLIPVFLRTLFGRYERVAVASYKKDLNNFSRSVCEFVLQVESN
jgi:cytochrome P450